MDKIDIVLDEIRKINTRLDGMEARFDGVEAKFDGMEAKFNKRFDVIEEHLARVTEKVNEFEDFKDRLKQAVG